MTPGAARLADGKRGTIAKITIRTNLMFHKQLITATSFFNIKPLGEY